jgi:hypothetical protein
LVVHARKSKEGSFYGDDFRVTLFQGPYGRKRILSSVDLGEESNEAEGVADGYFCGTGTWKVTFPDGSQGRIVLVHLNEPAGSSNYSALHSFFITW